MPLQYNRKIEIITVIFIAIIGTLFTFKFGNLIAKDHTAGLIGIPFLFFLLLFCLVNIFSKSQLTRKKMRITIISYLITLVSFSITILLIRNSTDNSFDFLYKPEGSDTTLADRLLFSFCFIGLTINALLISKISRKNKIKVS
ncbi:MAG: hypothetical protein ACJAQ2_001936 [Vicingaceae bacterium]|jgi:hypothetical protein